MFWRWFMSDKEAMEKALQKSTCYSISPDAHDPVREQVIQLPANTGLQLVSEAEAAEAAYRAKVEEAQEYFLFATKNPLK
jgi:hypothetical protein